MQAFEVIPRTLAQNCGVNVIRTMTALQAKVCSLHSVRDFNADLVGSSGFYLFGAVSVSSVVWK